MIFITVGFVYAHECGIEYAVNLKATCVLYIGQAFRCSRENAFYTYI